MTSSQKRLWSIAINLFGLAVIAGVAWYFAKVLTSPDLTLDVAKIRFEYLIPAGLLYLCTHTLWGTFWWQLLRDEDQPVPWRLAVSAYFISQFGKYVPGKVWVIFIRVAILRKSAARPAIAVTGIFETLTSMAAGALLGVATLSTLGIPLPAGAGSLPLFAIVAGVPIWLALTAKLAQKVVNARKGPDAPTLHAPSILLLIRGLLQASLGWCLLAVSLQLAIAAVRGEALQLGGNEFLANLAAVALSYVAGFVILFAPGGLGVRDWLLAYLIAVRWGGTPAAMAEAVVIALVLRLAWTVAEVLLAGSLWIAWRRRPHDVD